MEVRSQAAGVSVVTDPQKSAEVVGLRYVADDSPGIRRLKNGKTFRYINSNGKNVRDKQTLDRIKLLAIPPAWTDVWISPDVNGHLQATGRDARGRKQYRYHSRWREVRDETKFTRLILFGEALPRIRQRVKKDLALSGLSRRKVLATVIRLLETTFIRVGNDEYARENKSFGLTTLRNHHAEVNGSVVHFRFRGKGAKAFAVHVRDKGLAKIVKHCQELPGQDLFQYLDDSGDVQDVKSEDVNEYLREISGEDFTAKDFRTWWGTVLTARELCRAKQAKNKTQLKKQMGQALQVAAARLGNTPTICRKCYVHPAVFDAYQNGTFFPPVRTQGSTTKLSEEEKCVLKLLKKQLAEQREPLESKLRRSLSQVRKTKRALHFS